MTMSSFLYVRTCTMTCMLYSSCWIPFPVWTPDNFFWKGGTIFEAIFIIAANFIFEACLPACLPTPAHLLPPTYPPADIAACLSGGGFIVWSTSLSVVALWGLTATSTCQYSSSIPDCALPMPDYVVPTVCVVCTNMQSTACDGTVVWSMNK